MLSGTAGRAALLEVCITYSSREGGMDQRFLAFWDYLPHFSLAAILNLVVLVVFIPWVLLTKKDSTKAIAWCLAVIFMPFLGAFLFWSFGYNYLERHVRRRRHQRSRLRSLQPQPGSTDLLAKAPNSACPPSQELGTLAERTGAFPVSQGNNVKLYHETQQAFEALLEAVAQARHHVHMEFFIFHTDGTGLRLLGALRDKARQGVEVRLLYDGLGSLHVKRRALQPLVDAGGRVSVYLPVNPLRSALHINLRNHRKITVIDGRYGFTGGMNVGDEYMGLSSYFGYWRDSFLRVEGPAVAGLQWVFCDDWNFATRELLEGAAYYPDLSPTGVDAVQVTEGGPDREVNGIRELYFMAILSARKRLWMSSPYFVPDAGLLDALRVARHRRVDVRLLGIARPDHYLSFYASRYYWRELLQMGVEVYQYHKGMMHTKLMLVDDDWAMVGSANLDNRSLHLNYEIGCALHAPRLVSELADAYLKDLENSERWTKVSSLPVRVVENACRLLTPIL
jgi:cardiolipin synthase